MKTNPPFAHWNPEALAFLAYCLLMGVAMLVASSLGAGAAEWVGGVVFIGLGAGGIVHALRSRRRWLKSGAGPLPGQHGQAGQMVRKYKPLILGVGVLSLILVVSTGRLIPQKPEDIPLPLFAGMFLCMGIASHISYHRARRWLAQQEAELSAHSLTQSAKE